MLKKSDAHQFFDNIQISEKGMIKLIRNGGKDYVFPASEINDFQACEQSQNYNSNDLSPLFNLAGFFIGKMLNIEKTEQKPAHKLMLITDNGYLYVDVLYRDKYQGIMEAISKSRAIYKKKYGTFRDI